VWRELRRILPACSTLYVADNAHCPYGPRPPAEIQQLSLAISEFLLDQGADLIVVACNTASAAALETLRARLDVPVVGMEPAVKVAAERTQTGHIGVLATEGTLNGELFKNTSARYASGTTVHIREGTGLVDIVEQGLADSPASQSLLQSYLAPLFEAGADQLVLGCTHYSFLKPAIQRLVPAGVHLIDPARAVARQVQRVTASLPDSACQASIKQHRFFASGRPDILAGLVESEAGQKPHVNRIDWQHGRVVVVPEKEEST
jgi:glutamate racemase